MSSPKRIEPGDVVVATRDGGYDRDGLPLKRPRAGKLYRVETIYEMKYGLGCTLAGMDPSPYRGYLLFVSPDHKVMEPGWYFKPLEKADDEWTQSLYELLGSKQNEPICHTPRSHRGGDALG